MGIGGAVRAEEWRAGQRPVDLTGRVSKKQHLRKMTCQAQRLPPVQASDVAKVVKDD